MSKRVKLYSKLVVQQVTGPSKAKVDEIAAYIHKTSNTHPDVIGGQNKRKSTVASMGSYPTILTFDGKQ